MINVGVIGCGYWGPNLIRNFNQISRANLCAICDFSQQRLEKMKELYPGVKTTQDYMEIANNTEIDAIAIATPVFTHFNIAKDCLLRDKHVLVEKPMTSKSKQAEELIEIAQKREKVLMVDHTFIYTGAVRKIKEIISCGELGELYYFDSVRVNLGLFQQDINVLWDLAPHDISIMDYLLGGEPIAVSAIGASHAGSKFEDIAYLTVEYPNNLIAHIHVSWLAPVKVRMTFIGGSKKMIVYDDMEPSEKVKIYDKGVDITCDTSEERYKILVDYRIGDMYAPKLEQLEALRIECNHFIDCIQNNQTPLTDGIAGLRLVRILEAAQRSLENDSRKEVL